MNRSLEAYRPQEAVIANIKEFNKDSPRPEFRFGTWSMSRWYPSYATEQIQEVFINNLLTKTWDTSGSGFQEDVPEVKANRVYGQTLYEQLVTRDEKKRPWFDISYSYGMLKRLTQAYLGFPVYPLQDVNAAYTGNALVTPEDWFPIHKDSKGTISTVVLLPWLPPNSESLFDMALSEGPDEYNFEGENSVNELHGGELLISFDPHTRGLEKLKQNHSKIVRPDFEDIIAFAFDGTISQHGSLPVPHDSEPRFTIACTYALPGYDPNKRPEQFNKNRSPQAA